MAFLPAWKKKNNMTLLLFFEVKAVIEEHWGVEGKSEGDNGDVLKFR